MNIEEKIKNIQTLLKEGGNVIKTRDDRELILINNDNEIINQNDCSWVPEKF